MFLKQSPKQSGKPVQQGGEIASVKYQESFPYLMRMMSYTLFNHQDANCICKADVGYSKQKPEYNFHQHRYSHTPPAPQCIMILFYEPSLIPINPKYVSVGVTSLTHMYAHLCIYYKHILSMLYSTLLVKTSFILTILLLNKISTNTNTSPNSNTVPNSEH